MEVHRIAETARSNPGGGGVHFHHEWNMEIWMTKDWNRAEGGLEFFEGIGVPEQGLGVSSEYRCQWGSM